jgi:hypothetical protein
MTAIAFFALGYAACLVSMAIVFVALAFTAPEIPDEEDL